MVRSLMFELISLNIGLVSSMINMIRVNFFVA